MANVYWKEIKELFGLNSNFYICTVIWNSVHPQNLWYTNCMNSKLSALLDDSFKKTQSDLKVFTAAYSKSVFYHFIIQKNNKNEFPLIELIKTTEDITGYHFSYHKNKNIILKKIRPSSIKDITDLSYYIKYVESELSELKREEDLQNKKRLHQQKLYDINSTDADIELEEWKEEIENSQYEITTECVDFFQQFYEPIQFITDPDTGIKQNVYAINLKYKNLFYTLRFIIDINSELKVEYCNIQCKDVSGKYRELACMDMNYTLKNETYVRLWNDIVNNKASIESLNKVITYCNEKGILNNE